MDGTVGQYFRDNGFPIRSFLLVQYLIMSGHNLYTVVEVQPDFSNNIFNAADYVYIKGQYSSG